MFKERYSPKKNKERKSENSKIDDENEYLDIYFHNKYNKGKEESLKHLESIYSDIIEDKGRLLEKSIEQEILEKTREKRVLERFIRLYTGKDIVLERIGEKDVFKFELESDLLDELPKGYLYKGGSARSVLERYFDIDESSDPRDIDLAVIFKKEDSEISNMLAKKYMPDDYANGYGVEILEEDYFESRDFTINEVLYDGKEITASRQCILDTIRSVVRITKYEKIKRNFEDGDYHINPKLLTKALRFFAEKESKGVEMDFKNGEYYINPKLLAKALRFVSEKESKGVEMDFENSEAIRWIGIDDFHMALHLDRAIGQGGNVALNYIERLKEEKQLPSNIKSTREALEHLSKNLYDFVFKNKIDNQVELDNNIEAWSDIENDYILPKREGMKGKG